MPRKKRPLELYKVEAYFRNGELAYRCVYDNYDRAKDDRDEYLFNPEYKEVSLTKLEGLAYIAAERIYTQAKENRVNKK